MHWHLLPACLEVFHHHAKQPRDNLLDEKRYTDPVPPMAPHGSQPNPEAETSKWQQNTDPRLRPAKTSKRTTQLNLAPITPPEN